MNHEQRPPDRSSEQEDQKPGSPPRHATDPKGGPGAETRKTQTDPATGEDHGAPKGSEKL